jgi:hypothetical protein
LELCGAATIKWTKFEKSSMNWKAAGLAEDIAKKIQDSLRALE